VGIKRAMNALFRSLCAGLLAVAIVAPLAAAADNVTVVVDGQTMTFDQPPIVRAGRVFVPLRGVFERLGASVVYANGQINATGRGRTVSLTIGSTQATIDGQPATLDVAPFLVGDRTLVPLRFIAQALGATVNWDDSTSTVTILSTGRRPPVENPTPLPPRRGEIYFTTNSPQGTIYNHFPQVRFQINRPVQVGTFQVYLDGRDVTGGLQNDGNGFYFTAPARLPYGSHRVRVFGRTGGGMPFDLSWTFVEGSY